MAVNGAFVTNFPATQDVEFSAPQHVIVDSLPGGASSVVDVSDRAGRLNGHVTVDDLSWSVPQHVIVDSAPAAGADVTDRSARLLGHVNVDNTSLAVTVASLPLPSGAATSTKQPTLDADGGAPAHVTNWPTTQPVSLATNTPDVTDRSGRLLGHVNVDNFPATQPISASGLPLPSGAATDSNLTTVGGAAGTSPPALATSASGLIGWLRKIVDVLLGGIGVTGTFWQATQPVSLATNTPDVTDRSARLLGHVNVDNASLAVTAASLPLPSGAATAAKQPALGTGGTPATDVLTVQGIGTGTALKTDGSGVTQPVSGTVTSNAGTNLNTSALATSANLTAGTAKSQVTDGTNTAAVKAASTAPVAADPALVVSLSPNMGPTANNLLPSAAATINATVAKASAGRLYKIKGYNAKASVVYLKFWNKATTPAPASDAALIIFSFALKASDQFDIDLTPVGFAFASGISYTMSTGSANTDVTALVAADVVGLNVMYA